MNATELVIELEKLIAKHGDLPVFPEDGEYEFTTVEHYEDGENPEQFIIA